MNDVTSKDTTTRFDPLSLSVGVQGSNTLEALLENGQE
jgi:hypothetical protein